MPRLPSLSLSLSVSLSLLVSFVSSFVSAAPLPLSDPTLIPPPPAAVVAPRNELGAGNPSTVTSDWWLLILIVVLPVFLLFVGFIVGTVVYRKKFVAEDSREKATTEERTYALRSAPTQQTKTNRAETTSGVELQMNPAYGHETYAEDV